MSSRSHPKSAREGKGEAKAHEGGSAMSTWTKNKQVEGSGGKEREKYAGCERGFVLIIVLIIIAALALLGLAANRNMLADIGIAQNHGGNTRAFYAAEAAGEYVYNQLYQNLQQAGNAQTTGHDYTNALQNSIQGCIINAASYPIPAAAAQQKINATNGVLANFKGLNCWVQMFTITAKATDNSTNAASTVDIDIMNTLVPIFQFGIFYNGILEMNPGANLTIPVNGWIHTNANLFTSTSATETINSNITSAGQIIHNREPGDPQAVGTGNVSIEGSNGQYYNLGTGSQTVSNGTYTNNSQWASTVTQWGTQVAASEEGVQPLTLPMPAAAKNLTEYSTTNEALIAQGGTMNSLAAVVVTNDAAKDAKGNTLSTCFYNANHKTGGGSLKVDSGCTSGANQQSVTMGSVYDYRQSAAATTTDIDVEGFQSSAAGQYLATATPANGGTSGVLYVTTTPINQSFNTAIRLTGGTGLSSPLTVATDLPAYVQGNYNQGDSNHSVQPAAILSDATTVLSNQWSNSYSSSTGFSSRNVTGPLTINADIMTGNSATTSAGYGGGFENFIRFLENWSGQNYNFGGSLVCMWTAAQATAVWQNTGIYYNPPNRNYTFGVFGANWPPGTPNVIVTSRGTWRQASQ